MIIRQVTAADTDAVAALWNAVGLGSTEDVNRREIAERLKVNDGLFRCVEVDGEIIAGVMGCYDNHRGWVKRMAVHPSRQGQGIGSQLIADLEATFVEAGITQLRMSVFADNETGGAFWEAKGYNELENIRYFTKSLKT